MIISVVPSRIGGRAADGASGAPIPVIRQHAIRATESFRMVAEVASTLRRNAAFFAEPKSTSIRSGGLAMPRFGLDPEVSDGHA